MISPTDAIGKAVLKWLWDLGFRITTRNVVDPFDIHPSIVPGGWSYQWNTESAAVGWELVYHHEHPGYFAPLGTEDGPVVVGGLYLVKKKGDAAGEERKHAVRRSHEQLEGWADRFGMFTGGATMLQTDGEEVVRTEIAAGKGVEVKRETFERPATKTVDLTSKIPRDMVAYIDQIFAERDRLVGEIVQPDQTLLLGHEITDRFYDVIENDKAAPWWPTLHAIILPYAIDNVRKAVFQPN